MFTQNHQIDAFSGYGCPIGLKFAPAIHFNVPHKCPRGFFIFFLDNQGKTQIFISIFASIIQIKKNKKNPPGDLCGTIKRSSGANFSPIGQPHSLIKCWFFSFLCYVFIAIVLYFLIGYYPYFPFKQSNALVHKSRPIRYFFIL